MESFYEYIWGMREVVNTYSFRMLEGEYDYTTSSSNTIVLLEEIAEG